jgi:hypothetical protein
MSDCSSHKKDVVGISDMKQLAEMIGDLHYETLSDLLDQLSSKLFLDAAKDRAADRKSLANLLELAASEIHSASVFIDAAWEVSKPYMTKQKPQS